MLVRIYPSGILSNKGESEKNDQIMYVVTSREIFMHTSKVYIDNGELELGENDELLLEADMLRIVNEHFDSERDIVTCKEIRIYTKEYMQKETLQDIFEDTVIKTTHVE